MIKLNNFTRRKHLNQINQSSSKLPYFLEQALIGIILGDGHLGKSSHGLNANVRLNITFSNKYKNLAFYIAGLFCNYITPKGIRFSKVKSSKISKYYERISLITLANPIFNKYHNIFYKHVDDNNKKYVKIIPLNIEDFLSDISLAFLIMGDGNYHKQKRIIRLCTNSYSKMEVELLKNAIFNKFGIETRLEHTRNNQYILVVRTSQIFKLQNLVKEHIHPTMLYRIGLTSLNQI